MKNSAGAVGGGYPLPSGWARKEESCINQVQDVLQAQAAHAINLALTARNWLVGYYIVEFEQNGEDRAKYGENLLNRLSTNINRKGFEPRSLRLYRRFYLVHPQLGTEIGSYLQKNSLLTSNLGVTSIWQAAPAKLQTSENQTNGIWFDGSNSQRDGILLQQRV